MPLFIQTPRFVIRDFKPEEVKAYMSLFDDEMVTVHLPNRTRKEHLEIFHAAFKDYAENNPLGRWGMFNNGDGDFIGLCLLRQYDNPGQVELGYVMHQKYWGKGIASEMARILVSYGFTNTDANEIVAVTTLENIGSQRVLLKAGMERMPNFTRAGESRELAFFKIGRSAPL
ncbi:MAG: GNAT family N-acetyltransferase [Sphingobacteriales bacterium]